MNQELIDLMDKLKNVHRRFLELERLQAEKSLGKKLGPFEFFQVLTQDKSFAWLRPMSGRIAELDAKLEEDEVAAENKKDLLDEISGTLTLPQIKERYEAHRMKDPELALLHTEFMRTFEQLAK